MQAAVFPDLPGISWGVTKTPEFFSLTKVSPSGVDVAAALSAYPRWRFSLSYEFLRTDAAAELERLVGFFLARRGNVEDFLYKDPTDHHVDRQGFGVGDGTTTQFVLCRNVGGFIEPLYDTVDEEIFIGTTKQQKGYLVDHGIVIFTEAPPTGARLIWSGDFYYRCRFKESSMEFRNFSFKLWEAKTVEFVSTKKVFS
jgi:probable phage associated protein|nr:MAG TPA: minor tail protein [Caudoviricetes sp.]